jgi:hypothetical protein
MYDKQCGVNSSGSEFGIMAAFYNHGMCCTFTFLKGTDLTD